MGQPLWSEHEEGVFQKREEFKVMEIGKAYVQLALLNGEITFAVYLN